MTLDVISVLLESMDVFDDEVSTHGETDIISLVVLSLDEVVTKAVGNDDLVFENSDDVVSVAEGDSLSPVTLRDPAVEEVSVFVETIGYDTAIGFLSLGAAEDVVVINADANSTPDEPVGAETNDVSVREGVRDAAVVDVNSISVSLERVVSVVDEAWTVVDVKDVTSVDFRPSPSNAKTLVTTSPSKGDKLTCGSDSTVRFLAWKDKSEDSISQCRLRPNLALGVGVAREIFVRLAGNGGKAIGVTDLKGLLVVVVAGDFRPGTCKG